MSLLHKEYREPDDLPGTQFALRRHVKLLRETLEFVLDECTRKGDSSCLSLDAQVKIQEALTITKGFGFL